MIASGYGQPPPPTPPDQQPIWHWRLKHFLSLWQPLVLDCLLYCCIVLQAWRVLRPGGFLLVAFGSHFFPEKAIAGWTARSMERRTVLLSE